MLGSELARGNFLRELLGILRIIWLFLNCLAQIQDFCGCGALPEREAQRKSSFFGDCMKVYEKCDGKAIREIYKIADENIASKYDTDRLTFVFKDVSAICIFRLIADTGFKSPLLKSCYALSITFCGVTADGKPYVQPFSHKRAEEIVRTFFCLEMPFVFEHAPFKAEGVSANTYSFYNFVSIPYGKKSVCLNEAELKELLENNYVLYDTEESK